MRSWPGRTSPVVSPRDRAPQRRADRVGRDAVVSRGVQRRDVQNACIVQHE
jgi:hypothetical protein